MVIFHSYVSLPEGSLFSDISGSEVGKVWIWKVSHKKRPNRTWRADSCLLPIQDVGMAQNHEPQKTEGFVLKMTNWWPLKTSKNPVFGSASPCSARNDPWWSLGGVTWHSHPPILFISPGFQHFFLAFWALKVQCFSICWYISSYIILHHPTSSC